MRVLFSIRTGYILCMHAPQEIKVFFQVDCLPLSLKSSKNFQLIILLCTFWPNM